MFLKKTLVAAVALVGLSFMGGQVSAEPNVAAGLSVQSNDAVQSVRMGGPGGFHGGFHGGFRGGRPGYWRGGRWYWGAPLLAAPFAFGYYDGYYGGGSCYWNCRHYHGPAFCSRYSGEYCY